MAIKNTPPPPFPPPLHIHSALVAVSGLDRESCAPSQAIPALSSLSPFGHYREKLLRLPAVLTLVPVSRSAWYEGIKAGRYPPPIKLGPKTSAWREADIAQLITDLAAGR